VGEELTVVGIVVDTILLVVGEESFMRRDPCHDTLNLCIIWAAESLNKSKEPNYILILANAGEKARGLEIIFEVRGALMINNNMSFGHIFIILLLAFTCLCMHLLPEVPVNFGDRDEFPRFIGVGLGLGNIWGGNIGWHHVANGLGNIIAVVDLEVVCNIF
jgi:hypothetical protein